MHTFVKVSHIAEDGQEVMFRVNEQQEVCQILEFWDDEWQGVAGITSGMPIDFEQVIKVAVDGIDQMIEVESLAGPQKIKYSKVDAPDCESVRLFGQSTLADGYWFEDDETGEIDTNPDPKSRMH